MVEVMDIRLDYDVLTTVFSAIAGAMATYFSVRRLNLKDDISIQKCQSELNLITHLEETRDKALAKVDTLKDVIDETRHVYDDCLNKNKELTHDIDNLLARVRLLNSIIASLHTHSEHIQKAVSEQLKINETIVSSESHVDEE